MALSRPAGTLRVHPENYHYFVDGDRPVALLGRYHADFICSTDEHFTKDLDGYMAYLDGLNANFTQVWAIMIFSGRRAARYGVDTGGAQYMPFLRSGAGENYYGEPKYDLTKYDPAYFARFHDFLRATREHGIYVEVTLFDICGLKPTGHYSTDKIVENRWPTHPFHPANNINHFGLPADHAVGAERFFNLKNERLLAVQEAYVARLLEEVGDYGHVFFNVCNEYNGPFAWQEHWLQFVRRRRPDRILAVNNHGPEDPGAEHRAADVLNFHPGGGETRESHLHVRWCGAWERKAVSRYGLSRAVIADTDGYHPAELGFDAGEYIRKYAWSAFMNGQHFADMSHGGQADALMHCPPLPAFEHLRPFVEQMDFVHAAPRHELLLAGHEGECLARPGVEYALYLRYGGPHILDTSHARGPLSARWYNPRTGAWGEPFAITPAYRTRLDCPDRRDWALHIAADRAD